jgi:hypothetical protein
VRGAVDLRQLLQAAGLFGALVLVSTVIFISMPRYQFEQSFSFPSMRGVSGFNDHVTYSEERGIDTDDSVAFRVDAPPGISFPTKPYWRMIVLDEYRNDGFRLSNGLQRNDFSKNLTVRYPDDTDFVVRPRLADVPPFTGTWTFYLEGNVSEYLPVLGQFDLLTFSSTQAFRANEDVKVYRTETTSPKAIGYEIKNMDLGDAVPATNAEMKPGFVANFTLEQVDTLHSGGGFLFYPNTYYGLPNQVNDLTNINDRTIIDGLRDGIRASIQGPVNDELAQHPERDRATVQREAYLDAVMAYLQKNHRPSMDMNLTGTDHNGHDMLVRWMNTPMSAGWCEFYAGAFVLLARDGGYPARMVSGYKGVDFNSIENYYVVRQSFAHAWAEVFNGQDRWVRYDPTPGDETLLSGQAGGSANTGPVVENGLGAFVDSLRMIWYRRVINFDQTDQQELAATVTQYGKDFVKQVESWLSGRWIEIKGWFRGPLTPTRVAVFAGVALALALGWMKRGALRNLWLRGSGWILLGQAQRLPPVRLDAGRWLRRFQPVWQARAPVLPAPERAQWEGVWRDLLALRYGPLDAPPDAALTFRLAKALLRTARRAGG